MKKEITLIVAVDDKSGIGKDQKIPWKISKDVKFFKDVTTKNNSINKRNAVLMGRKTWDSIPEKFRPLPSRYNCIISRDISLRNDSCDILWQESMDDCLLKLEENNNIETIHIIGGGYFFNEILKNPGLNKIYLTKVKGDFNCDVFFKGIPNNFTLETKSEIFIENGIEFIFETWIRNTNS